MVAIPYHLTAFLAVSVSSKGELAMNWLPSILQFICLTLELYLILKLPKGMPRDYLIFSLARSVTRLYAQWLCTPQTWAMVYWCGELLGSLVVIVLVAVIADKLLKEHINTAFFYSTLALSMALIIIWKMPLPVSFEGCLRACNWAKVAALFLLLMTVVLAKRWHQEEIWIATGVVANFTMQFIGGYTETLVGPTVVVSLVSQSGFFFLLLLWLKAIAKYPSSAELKAG